MLSHTINHRGKTMKIYNDKIELAIETKLKPNLKTLYDLRVRGFKDYQIADYLGISRKIFDEALTRNELVMETYNDATQYLCSQLRGWSLIVPWGLMIRPIKTETLLGPDANLALRLLEKTRPLNLKNTQDVHIDMGMTIEQVIHALAEKKKSEDGRRKWRHVRNARKYKDIYAKSTGKRL